MVMPQELNVPTDYQLFRDFIETSIIKSWMSIDNIAPTPRLELNPLDVQFTLHNFWRGSTAGRVVARWGTSGDIAGQCEIPPNIARGAEHRATLRITAPMAAPQVDLLLQYYRWQDVPPDDQRPESYDLVSVDIAASYVFTIPQMWIEDTRALLNDTDFATAVLIHNSDPPQSSTVSLGDLGQGHHQVNLAIGPVALVPSNADTLTGGYLIVNSGHDSSGQDGLDLVSDLTAAVLSVAFSEFKDEITAVNGLVHWLNSIIFADCDGVVAASRFSVSGATLDQLTRETGTWAGGTRHPGLDSPHGCGANSSYWVAWQFERRTHPQPRPSTPPTLGAGGVSIRPSSGGRPTIRRAL